jgi:putative SOS response-associated peptidase YedK
MCGRFEFIPPSHGLPGRWVPLSKARYNIAPGQDIDALLGERGEAQHGVVRWGLIPSWAKDASIGQRMINARSETAATKPAFRAAMKARRALILATGYYEWQAVAAGPKQPWHFTLPGHEWFAFAGLWERWTSPEGEVVESATILTCDANRLQAPVHDRMPVILGPGDHERWLDPATSVADATALLVPYAAAMLRAPVSTLVNSPRHDAVDCVAAVGPVVEG